jgi:hypothetical protein
LQLKNGGSVTWEMPEKEHKKRKTRNEVLKALIFIFE